LEKNFEIGQVVYILSEQAQSILPGIVAEEVSVKKLSGNSVSWKVKVGQGDKAKLFDSAKIKGDVYGSLDEVREVMTQRLNEYIDKISLEAEVRVEKWYGKEISERQKVEQNHFAPSSGIGKMVDDRIDPDLLLSSLENMPPTAKFTPEANRASDPKASLRDRLEAMVAPENEEGSVFITDLNGDRVAVRMPKV